MCSCFFFLISFQRNRSSNWIIMWIKCGKLTLGLTHFQGYTSEGSSATYWIGEIMQMISFHLNEIQSLSREVNRHIIYIMHNKFLEESAEPRNSSNYLSPQLYSTFSLYYSSGYRKMRDNNVCSLESVTEEKIKCSQIRREQNQEIAHRFGGFCF